MGNRKAREVMLQREQDAIWQSIRTEPRPITQGVYARGIGALRVQLIVRPSFVEAKAWEIRQLMDEWRLFSPRVLQTQPEMQLVGYDQIEFSSEQLATYFRRITSLTLPLRPGLSGCGGVDGTTYQLAVFGDGFSSYRFQWWSDAPDDWQPLVDVVTDMILNLAPAQWRESLG